MRALLSCAASNFVKWNRSPPLVLKRSGARAQGTCQRTRSRDIGVACRKRCSMRRLKGGVDCAFDAAFHETGGFGSDAQRAMKLIGAQWSLIRAQKINRAKPQMHRHMARLKHRADLHGEGLATCIALVSAEPRACTLQACDAAGILAMGANWAFRPQLGFHKGKRSGLVHKDPVRKPYHDNVPITCAFWPPRGELC
jgi:hypothetical protein